MAWRRAAIIGASGGIGSALAAQDEKQDAKVYRLSRHDLDLTDMQGIQYPCTVETEFSWPFDRYALKGKVFIRAYTAEKLLYVVASLGPEQGGRCFGWAGMEIAP